MNVTNIPDGSDVEIAYIVTKDELNKTYKQCPVLTINFTNNDNMKFLQLGDNHNPSSQGIHLPKVKPNNQPTLNSNSNIVYRVLHPEDLQLQPATIKRKLKKNIHSQAENDVNEIPKKVFRTRSGRMSKPPKHIQQDKEIKEVNQVVVDDVETINLTETTNINNVNKIDKVERKTQIKRNISAQYRCGTCQKAYLGYNKMAKHLKLHPDHIAPSFMKKAYEFNLWQELIRKTKEAPKDQQVELFCKEFFTLIHKARIIIPKLLKSAEKESSVTVDSIVSSALGIPEGNYSFDEKLSIMELIDSCINDNKTNFEELEENSIQNDQTSLLNLLDTGQVTFDSSSAEEVMNVDQLVNERLKTLTGGGELEVSNNVSQNLNLDLSLDMFSYNST